MFAVIHYKKNNELIATIETPTELINAYYTKYMICCSTSTRERVNEKYINDFNYGTSIECLFYT